MVNKLSDFLKTSVSLDAPGAYEFYEIESKDDITRRFIIKNIVNSKSILVKSVRNKVEVDQNFVDYNNTGAKKISVIKFFERLSGLGISYV